MQDDYNEVLTQVRKLRKENKDYDRLISSITEKLEVFIDMKNNKSSYNPKGSIYCKPKIEVEAIKMNAEEKNLLLRYLDIGYIDKVKGRYFVIKKKTFSKKYKVYTWTEY